MYKWLYRAVLVALLALILFLFWILHRDAIPLTLGTNKVLYGYIDRGEKFNVSIDDSRHSVIEKFKNDKIDKYYTGECGELITIECKHNLLTDGFYFDNGIYHGRIFVIYKNNRVASIVWDFYFLPTIDT